MASRLSFAVIWLGVVHPKKYLVFALQFGFSAFLIVAAHLGFTVFEQGIVHTRPSLPLLRRFDASSLLDSFLSR